MVMVNERKYEIKWVRKIKDKKEYFSNPGIRVLQSPSIVLSGRRSLGDWINRCNHAHTKVFTRV
jgi:hypothetical protein